MPVLQIGNQKVQVDDSFASLSPEEQQQTVDEIEQSLTGGSPAPKEDFLGATNGRVDAGASPAPHPSGGGLSLTDLITGRRPPQGNAANETMAGPFVDTVTFGAAPKVAAAGRSAIDQVGNLFQGKETNFGDDYNTQLANIRADMDAYEQANPKTAMASRGVGMLAGAAVMPELAPFKAAGLAAEAGNAAATGGAYGALSGALKDADSLQERAVNTAEDAGLSAIFAPILSTIASRVLPFGKRIPNDAPTTEQIGLDKKAAFDAAEGAGLVYNPAKVEPVMKDIVNEARKTGIGVMGAADEAFPSTTRLMKGVDQFDAAGGTAPPTLSELNMLKRLASGIGRRETEIPGGKMAAGKIRDFINSTTPNDILAGDIATGIPALQKANQLTVREKKAEVLDQIENRVLNKLGANQPISSKENAILQEWKALANNKKSMDLFSKEEQDAIRKVVRGSSVKQDPIHYGLRLLGVLAPSGKLSGAAYAAGAVSHPGIAVPLMAVTGGAKLASSRLTQNNADAADYFIRTGKQPKDHPVEEVLRKLLEIFGAPAASNLIGGAN